MAITSLTTADRIAARLSWSGVDARIDHAPPDVLADVILSASADVLSYLGRRYTNAQLAASEIVSTWTADVAVYHICRVRGNPVPASVQRRYDDLLKRLAQMEEGKGIIADVSNAGTAPAVVNHSVNYDVNPSKRRLTGLSEPKTVAGYPSYPDRREPPPFG
jgi:phage gp36-like protein